MKSKTSIVKKQSALTTQNDKTYSNSICCKFVIEKKNIIKTSSIFLVLSTGILLTNTLNETDFIKINTSTKHHSSNLNNTTINSNNTDSINNSQTDIPSTTTTKTTTSTSNLRKYQSDDSIYSKYLIKLIDNCNKKKPIAIKTKIIEKPVDIIVIDPLGAYLQTSTIPTDPLSALLVNENTNIGSEKLVNLFEYEPFRAERDEENNNVSIAENDSFNGENFDDNQSYSEDEDLDAFIEEEDEDEESTDDEEDEEDEENDDDEDVNVKLSDNENAILTKYKNANDLLNSFVTQVTNVTNSIELNSKFKDVRKFTTDKFSVLKSSLQTNMPYSISQQEITTKLKSFSGYALNKNLISTFSGNSNSNNSLNNSINNNNSFQNKKNSFQKDAKSTGLK
jgi:hypothetical protein